AHLDRGRVLLAQDDDLGDVALDVVQRRKKHLPRLHPLRIDVLVADVLEHLVDDLELRQIVVRRGVAVRPVVGGARRGEPFPEPAPVEAEREPAGDSEGSEEREELERAGEQSHWFEYRRARARAGDGAWLLAL